MTRRRTAAIVIAAVLVAGLATASLGDGWNLETSAASPDGRFRLDLYRGTRWQRLAYRAWYEDPGFARMSRTRDGAAMATSPVIELADSRITWTPAGVLIATQAQYRYATGTWN